MPLATTVLLLASAAIARMLRPPTRVVGRLHDQGARCAELHPRRNPDAAGATASRPTHRRPAAGGQPAGQATPARVAVPLTAAAVGWIDRRPVWFVRPTARSDRYRWRVRALIAAFMLAVLAVYAVAGFTDVAGLPQLQQLGVHLTVTLVALTLLRIGLHLALLHEAHDPMTGEPVLSALRASRSRYGVLPGMRG